MPGEVVITLERVACELEEIEVFLTKVTFRSIGRWTTAIASPTIPTL